PGHFHSHVRPPLISPSATCFPAPTGAFTSLILAGAEGFEPPSPVLETGSLTVELTPLFPCHPEAAVPGGRRSLATLGMTAAGSHARQTPSLNLFMRRVLAALPAELVEFQPGRRGLLVLGRGVVAIFALSTLQCNNLAGH